jgi:hypothetical protein
LKLSGEAMRVLEALAAKQGPTETDRLRALVRLNLDANTLTLMTDRARLGLPPDVVEPLEQLGDAVHQASREAPNLLSELLPLLPSTAQTRLLILALTALNAMLEYIDVEAGIDQPAHITTLVYAIAAIATLLNESTPDR